MLLLLLLHNSEAVCTLWVGVVQQVADITVESPASGVGVGEEGQSPVKFRNQGTSQTHCVMVSSLEICNYGSIGKDNPDRHLICSLTVWENILIVRILFPRAGSCPLSVFGT